jgi:EAL domain-containing protein (putative c-di-GMP-specific phosphodiesterase class I)
MSWSINLFASDLNDRYLLSSIKELCRFSPRGLCGVELNFNCIEDKLVALGNLIRSMPNLHVTIDEVDQCNDSLDAVIASGIHAVKIKADLIAAHCQTSQGRALIERLQGLCNQHDCKLIAEHIETNQSLTAVKNMRIQYGQGFYLSHPVPKVIAVHSA